MRRPGCRRRWEKTGRARVVWKGHPRVSWRKGASEYAGWRPEIDILRYTEIPSRVTRQPTTPRNGLVVPDLISDLVVGDNGDTKNEGCEGVRDSIFRVPRAVNVYVYLTLYTYLST